MFYEDWFAIALHITETCAPQMKSLERDLIPRPFPYQVSLAYQGTREMNPIGGYDFSSVDKYKNNLFTEQPKEEFWNSFKVYLKTTHRDKSIICRLSYAKKYYHILINGDASDIQSTSNDKRLQVMKSLSVLSKFMDCYDNWKDIKEQYQLKWSNENSLDTFKKIINEDNSFNNLLEWLKKYMFTNIRNS